MIAMFPNAVFRGFKIFMLSLSGFKRLWVKVWYTNSLYDFKKSTFFGYCWHNGLISLYGGCVSFVEFAWKVS